MYTVLKLCRPFEGNREADVAPGEHEFDTPGLDEDEAPGASSDVTVLPLCYRSAYLTSMLTDQLENRKKIYKLH